MPVDFPSSPTLNQIYTYGEISWKWNGAAWDNISSTLGPQGTQGIQGVQGIQGFLGLSGFRSQLTAPAETTVLWLDTSVTATAGVQGIQGIQGIQGFLGPQGTQGIIGLQGTLGTQGLSGVSNVSINAQTGTSYTLSINDVGNFVTLNNAASITATIPPSVFSVGQIINIQQINTGQVTFAQGAGVAITSTGTTSSAPKLRSQYSGATVLCTGSNTFTIMGDIV